MVSLNVIVSIALFVWLIIQNATAIMVQFRHLVDLPAVPGTMRLKWSCWRDGQVVKTHDLGERLAYVV